MMPVRRCGHFRNDCLVRVSKSLAETPQSAVLPLSPEGLTPAFYVRSRPMLVGPCRLLSSGRPGERHVRQQVADGG